jgi:hypothetical protein
MLENQTKDTAVQTIFTTLNIYQKIGLVTLVVSIFSALSFLTTYTFLYGYYFGGELDNSFSNFEIYRRFVPFHLNTMAFTWLMISLSVSLVIYALKVLRGEGVLNKLLALMCLIIFHVIMTVFFSQQINLTTIVHFGAIWIFPVFIGVIILFFIYGIRAPFKSFSGALFGISILSICVIFVPNNLSEEWILIWFNIALFTCGTVFYYLPYKKHLNFIFIFPYIFLLVVAVVIGITPAVEYFKDQTNLIKSIIIIFIPLLVSYCISLAFEEKFVEKMSLSEASSDKGTIYIVISEVLNGIINPKTHKGTLMFIILMLLGAYVMTPRVSIATAKIIRSFTPASEFQHDVILVKDLEEKTKTIHGIIVAEHDNVVYISNEKWELEQIKTDNYFVERNIE